LRRILVEFAAYYNGSQIHHSSATTRHSIERSSGLVVSFMTHPLRAEFDIPHIGWGSRATHVSDIDTAVVDSLKALPKGRLEKRTWLVVP
jgi:hypothetical protein